MVKTREKKVIYANLTTDEMEAAFAEFATADAKLQKINANLDVEFTRIRDRFADEILRLGEAKQKAFGKLQAFAVQNRDVVFAKKKSLDTVHGIIGFRTGTPKLKTLRGHTWASVTGLLSAFLPDYVRTTIEPAKDRLLADRENEKIAPLFAKVGIEVVQDETFFVEPKKEDKQ